MGARNTLDMKGGGAPPVDKMLGTAYDTVRSLVLKLPVIEYLEKNIDGFVTDIHNALDATLDAEKTAIAKAAEALASQLAAQVSEIAAKASELAAAQSAADADASATASAASEAESTLQAGLSKASADAAHASESASHYSEVASAASQAAAKLSETNAGLSATAASVSQAAAAQSAADAAASSGDSSGSASAAHDAQVAAEAARDAAALSQGKASVSEGNAKTSETNSKASEVASAASALAAHNSEVAAAGSATTAGAQATIATDKATAAATAATQLTAALASFSSLWLGPHATDPTTDNLGNALQEGARYENTSTTPAKIRVYHNGAWQDESADAAAATASATLAATNAAASAGQASVSQTAAAGSAETAQNWATEMGTMVDGVDYSAKQYAQYASNEATDAAGSATAADASKTAAAASATAASASSAHADEQAQAAALSATAAAASAAAINGEKTIDVSQGDVTLSAQDSLNAIFRLTGNLGGAVRVITLAAQPHNFVVRNESTGGGSVTFKVTGASPSASVLQGSSATLSADTTGVYATSATPGVGYSNVYPEAGSVTLGVSHIGSLVIQKGVGTVTTMPKASTYPAGMGVTIKSAVASSLALQAGDTCDDLAMPYAMLAKDTVFMVSDGVSKWTVGWFSNKASPVFDDLVTAGGGVQFPDGSVQTTANTTTQPDSLWYTEGMTDTVGSFAEGDTSLRTSGFTAPYVKVIRDGFQLRLGTHFTLNGDGIHIDLVTPLGSDEEVEVQTQGVVNPSATFLPGLAWLQPAAGDAVIPFAHSPGFAFLMLRGVLLERGVDYTDDEDSFFLNGWKADGTEKFGVFNFNAVTLANVLMASNPVITGGSLQFADGTKQDSAGLEVANNLSDLKDLPTARKNLGVGRTLLSTQQLVSGANFAILTLPTGYDDFEIEFDGVNSTDSTASLVFNVGDTTASWFQGTVNSSVYEYLTIDGTSAVARNLNTARITLFTGIANTAPFSTTGTVKVRQARDATRYKQVLWELNSMTNAGGFYNVRGGGVVLSGGLANYALFQMSAGNFAAGRFSVYGINR